MTFGKFTDLNIWSEVITPKVINNMSKSLNFETEPLLKWSDVEIDLINFEENYEKDESLFSNAPENLFVVKMKTFFEGISTCKSMGGEIATPLENTMIETWINITNREKLGRLFLNYYDPIKEKVFRNVYTGKLVKSF